MVTIADIAKAAGVSKTTVSKALNDYTDISDETKKKVTLIAREMGYFPNSNAKALITKKNWLVGVLFTESLDVGLEHPMFGGVIEAFKKTMEENGYDTIFITSRIGHEKTSYLNHCRYRNVDGVFVCTFAGEDPLLNELFESDIKCVTTDVSFGKIPLIISDNIEGMCLSYEYLYNMGHRKIAFVPGPQNTLSGRERLTGYKKALKEHGQSFSSQYIAFAHDYDYISGYNAGIELMEKCLFNPPTAILTCSDIVALGVMKAVEEKGYKIPRDISIVGFDNIELSRYCKPALTTVNQSRRMIGIETAKNLIALIKGDEVPLKTIIPVEITERETCAAPFTAKSHFDY